MRSGSATAARLGLALGLAGALCSCGGDESDPDPARALAAGAARASGEAAEARSGNSAPVIAGVVFNPPQPISEGILEALVDVSDPDGNLVQLTYQWSVNGDPIGDSSKASVRLPKLERGDRVELSVVASDGRAASEPFTLSTRTDNLPPQITFLYVTPQNKKIRRGDVLTAVPEASDPENDHIEFSYRWAVNGEEAGDERQLDTKALKRGDVVTLEVVANDGYSESDVRKLDPIELVNSAPVITKLPQLEHQGSTLAYQFEAEDAEGDRNLRFFLADAPDGMEIDAISGLLTWRPSAEQTGKHVVKVGVRDSEGDASQFEWEVTVKPAPPAASGE
jgi:hypothetical protein